ncbi:hypothetical protein AVEN_135955-1 [Araneus ventricosus]|uniref:Uncharacterized protein n=1 Tax=Araneus ventricosus TaxID=182803 RepID=A0A4Y2L8B7_ARAVE|nr:hypothetical protein AVEN_135955-1 [Araneus ventricosus]
MNWTLPTWVVLYPTTPAITFPYGARKWAVIGKDNWTLLPRLSPKLSQNLTSPQKEANRLRLSIVAVKGKFLDSPGPPLSVSEG